MGACHPKICPVSLEVLDATNITQSTFCLKIRAGTKGSITHLQQPRYFLVDSRTEPDICARIVTSLNLSRHHNSAILFLLLNIKPDPIHGEVEVFLSNSVR